MTREELRKRLDYIYANRPGKLSDLIPRLTDARERAWMYVKWGLRAGSRANKQLRLEQALNELEMELVELRRWEKEKYGEKEFWNVKDLPALQEYILENWEALGERIRKAELERGQRRRKIEKIAGELKWVEELDVEEIQKLGDPRQRAWGYCAVASRQEWPEDLMWLSKAAAALENPLL